MLEDVLTHQWVAVPFFVVSGLALAWQAYRLIKEIDAYHRRTAKKRQTDHTDPKEIE